MNAATNIYLESCLAPLAPLLARGDVTDLYINRPREVWVETLGGKIEQIERPELTHTLLQRLARQIAAVSAQGVSREYPLLAASLPGGERVQVVLPPATRGEIAIAIRKHVVADLSLDHYDATSENFRLGTSGKQARAKTNALKLGSPAAILREAVHRRRNVLVSGGTSSGKTTLLNALLREVPQSDRLIFIEDTPELRSDHPNQVGLLAPRGDSGEARVSADDLLIAALRMRPDRIILGEIRGAEAATFLRAVNTGHPGSLSTIHADCPERAIDQLALLVLQTGMRMDWDNVVTYVRRSLDLIVQVERHGGRRRMVSIMDLRDGQG